MSSVPQKEAGLATYADLEALPDHLVGEIIAGELVVAPRPSPRHARAASRLGMTVGPPFDLGEGGPGGWWILFEPELRQRGDVLVPDLAGWRRERLPDLPEEAGITVAPDWICEVLSPSTSRQDRGAKLSIYAREGVRHAWLVDPVARTLEILRLSGEGWLIVAVHGEDDIVHAEPFEAIALDLLALWGEPRSPTEP